MVEGGTLLLRLSPARTAADLIARLEASVSWQADAQQGSGGGGGGRPEADAMAEADLDARAATLELADGLLFDRHIANAFVQLGGVASLLRLGCFEGGDVELQANAMQALRTALVLPSAMEELLLLDGAPSLVKLTYGENARAVSISLELLCMLCTHEDGFRGCEPCRLKKAQAARLAKQEAELRKGPPLPLSPGRKA